MNNCKILITDDDDIFRSTVRSTLISNSDCSFEVYEAKVGDEALDIVSKHPDISCIILDYNFEKYGGPGQMNGLEIAEKIKDIAPQIPIIMTSEVGDRGDIAMKAAKNYIHGFLDKPFSEKQLLNKIKQFHKYLEVSENDYNKAQTLLSKYGYVSVSKRMQRVCYEALIAAQTDWNVLLLGETGTGKTLLANIIHQLSNRSNKPFIAANCGAITPSLIESELFGHTKGSFTGANDNKKGLFEIAKDGTLFLDEIAEIPLEIQAKLNYAIDDNREFYKVGRPDIKIRNKARIIAATLHDTKEAVDKNMLRKDIEARFTTIIKIPPLRERQEDIKFLTHSFIDSYKTKLEISKNIEISNQALNLLSRQPWPKNAHQLSSVIKKVLLKSVIKNKNAISVNDIKEELSGENTINSDELENKDLSQLSEILAISLLDNIEDILPEKIKRKGSGGLRYLTSILEKYLIELSLDRNSNNVLSTSKYLYENKDTLRNHMKTIRRKYD